MSDDDDSLPRIPIVSAAGFVIGWVDVAAMVGMRPWFDTNQTRLWVPWGFDVK